MKKIGGIRKKYLVSRWDCPIKTHSNPSWVPLTESRLYPYGSHYLAQLGLSWDSDVAVNWEINLLTNY